MVQELECLEVTRASCNTVRWWCDESFAWNSVCAVGGVLGVMYSIPLRRALVTQSDLPYPEGVAAAEFATAPTENTGAAGGGFAFGLMIAAAALQALRTAVLRLNEDKAFAADALKTLVAMAGRSLAEAVRLGILDFQLDWSATGLQRIYENMQTDGVLPRDRPFAAGNVTDAEYLRKVQATAAIR